MPITITNSSSSPDLSCTEQLPQPHAHKKQKTHHHTDHDRYEMDDVSRPLSPIHDIMTRNCIEEYERLIYQIQGEMKYMVQPYLHITHTHITTGMRRMIIDWMNECEEDLHLDHETYVCAVYYLDRYLSLLHRPLNPDNYQLCASVALLISSKFHAILPIRISSIRAKAADYYRISDYKVLELHMLTVLGYHMAMITPHAVLQQMFIVFTQIPTEIRPQAEFCCDAAFCEYDFLGVRPSVLAFACILCACELVNCSSQQILSYQQCIIQTLPDVFDMTIVESIRSRIRTLVHHEFAHIFQHQPNLLVSSSLVNHPNFMNLMNQINGSMGSNTGITTGTATSTSSTSVSTSVSSKSTSIPSLPPPSKSSLSDITITNSPCSLPITHPSLSSSGRKRVRELDEDTNSRSSDVSMSSTSSMSSTTTDGDDDSIFRFHHMDESTREESPSHDEEDDEEDPKTEYIPSPQPSSSNKSSLSNTPEFDSIFASIA